MYKLPEMIGYVNYFDSNKTMSFKVIDKELLKRYIKVCERINSLIEFGSEPVYGDNDKYIKTKIKSYGDKTNTNIKGNKNVKRKCIKQMFVIDNDRFYY